MAIPQGSVLRAFHPEAQPLPVYEPLPVSPFLAEDPRLVEAEQALSTHLRAWAAYRDNVRAAQGEYDAAFQATVTTGDLPPVGARPTEDEGTFQIFSKGHAELVRRRAGVVRAVSTERRGELLAEEVKLRAEVARRLGDLRPIVAAWRALTEVAGWSASDVITPTHRAVLAAAVDGSSLLGRINVPEPVGSVA